MPATMVWRRRWREHPLRRPVDVAEAWLLLVLRGVLWTGALLAGVLAGAWAYGHAEGAAAEQAVSRHQVNAVIVEDVPDDRPWADGRGHAPKIRVDVRWTAQDGRVGTGVAAVPANVERGDRTTVWVDAHGRITEPPMSRADVWTGALAVGATVLIVAGGGAASAGLAVHGAAARRREAQWEDEWRRVEPEWTGRDA